MKSLIIALLLFAIKCSAQSPIIDVRSGNKDVLDRHQKSLREQAYLNELHYDTIPCHLLYRTQAGQVGIVKGWEVRKMEATQIPDMGIMDNFGNVKPVTYKEILAPKHITYLRYNRRRFPKGTEVWKLE